MHNDAYTECMQNIRVSDKQKNCRYIAYVANVLQGKEGIQSNIAFQGDRAILQVEASGNMASLLKYSIAEKVAEVICIGYKYDYLKQNIKIAGLNKEDIEILYASIIAADFPEERKYLVSYLEEMQEHTIDGFYNFRLCALQKKWKGVINCLPSSFSKKQLADFMEYLIGGRKGKVFLKGQKVYDSRCRRLRRADLIEEGGRELNSLREIVLSCAGKVECLTALSSKQESFLKSYYAGRVGFFSS